MAAGAEEIALPPVRSPNSLRHISRLLTRPAGPHMRHGRLMIVQCQSGRGGIRPARRIPMEAAQTNVYHTPESHADITRGRLESL